MKTFSIQPGPVSPSVSSGTRRARGDDQNVVVEFGPVLQMTSSASRSTRSIAGLAELDARVQLTMPRPDDLVGVGQAEGDEEQTRLVDVVIVLVHDNDLDVVRGKMPAQTIGAEGPAGSPTEDHDPFDHDPMVDHTS